MFTATISLGIFCFLLLILLLIFYSKLNNDLFSGAKSYFWFMQYTRFWLLFKKKLPIALLDIDDFKSINSHGIQFGDLVLKEFVAFSKKHLLNYSIARYRHGDEFVVVSLRKSPKSIEDELNALNAWLLSQNLLSNKTHKISPIQFKFVVGECKNNEDFSAFLLKIEEELMLKKQLNKK